MQKDTFDQAKKISYKLSDIDEILELIKSSSEVPLHIGTSVSNMCSITLTSTEGLVEIANQLKLQKEELEKQFEEL